jgi:hypothetical protein
MTREYPSLSEVVSALIFNIMNTRYFLKRWGWEHTTLILGLLLVGTSVYAGQYEYQPLVGLPQLDGQGKSLSSYFNQIYIATIAVGAILAFIKISIAGVKWSMSDIVTDKSDAKKDIQGALLGLAILLIPFIVLNTIYDGLTKLNILEKAMKITPAVNTYQPPPTNNNSGTPLYVDGTQSQSVTKSACEARAAKENGTYIWTPTYNIYGNCTVIKPTTTDTTALRLLRTQYGMTSSTQCTTLAASLKIAPVTYTEGKYTTASGKCEVWGKP